MEAKKLKGKNKKLNPKNEPLTTEKLKTFQGLENLSDDEAEKTLEQIKVISAILIEVLKDQERENKQNNLKQAA